ncbi:hypothetical protein K491DRAFT_756934 [Lophiostoma macrostomum CBS 122681]|uniref:BTB domain-containing protein n=1 Tax=Lophiostoma macrostomum CBS 122681 TaxID=1314788 RepID=A0A6A6TEC8_9PLEO|nr:hypothetical protein K491DRAFT_756934 [Lophiostoma macrostomum CBS 122681]
MAADRLPVVTPDCSYEEPGLSLDAFERLILVRAWKPYQQKKDRKEFSVHRGLLSHHSVVFRETLQRTPRKNILELPGEDPDIVGSVVYWMYTGKLSQAALDAQGKIPLTLEQLCQVFSFGEKNGIPELRNIAITIFFQKSVQDSISPDTLMRWIYANTLPGSALRRYLVDYMVERCNFLNVENVWQGIAPAAFLLDILARLRMLQKPPSAQPPTRDEWLADKKRVFCERYHDHTPVALPPNEGPVIVDLMDAGLSDDEE